MTPFTTVTGPGAALPRDNVDTDQLIPARFMKRSRTEGYGDQLLHDLRFDPEGRPRPDFPLNRLPAPPALLVAGANFGCGSSREAAVYALWDHGIRTVVASGFADIFRNNAARNGLLTVALPEAERATLCAWLEAHPGAETHVDLEAQRIEAERLAPIAFDIDPQVKRRLLLGLDELSETLEEEESIARFEAAYLAATPWALPRTTAR
ncbi:3-isopropylmalate dehydratase small subunit [Oceanicella sp. SM1341]|uniref:3-isopropylmalate dehydratase small subunit n=1 Tax=Oceanicella sp. SM1341 TaxID=1548889 RepID=UPI000E471F40|nr:3-isopropylmalate dehydratase small subunit [Oceanicella sp. SM1341]